MFKDKWGKNQIPSNEETNVKQITDYKHNKIESLIHGKIEDNKQCSISRGEQIQHKQ